MIKAVDVLSATDDELRTLLLTVDGQGKDNKRRALEELIDRAESKVWNNTAPPM